MAIKVNGISYLTTTDVLEQVNVTRQTLWRWRQDGKIPSGSRLRNRQLIFSLEEVETIRDFANRIDPINDPGLVQLGLFNELDRR